MLYDFNIIIYYSISLLTSFCCRSNRISIKWWWCIAYLLYYNMQWTLVYWLWTCLSRSNRNSFSWWNDFDQLCCRYFAYKKYSSPIQIHNYEKNKFSLINKAHILWDRQGNDILWWKQSAYFWTLCMSKKQNLKRNINFLKIKLT